MAGEKEGTDGTPAERERDSGGPSGRVGWPGAAGARAGQCRAAGRSPRLLEDDIPEAIALMMVYLNKWAIVADNCHLRRGERREEEERRHGRGGERREERIEHTEGRGEEEERMKDTGGERRRRAERAPVGVVSCSGVSATPASSHHRMNTCHPASPGNPSVESAPKPFGFLPRQCQVSFSSGTGGL